MEEDEGTSRKRKNEEEKEEEDEEKHTTTTDSRGEGGERQSKRARYGKERDDEAYAGAAHERARVRVHKEENKEDEKERGRPEDDAEAAGQELERQRETEEEERREARRAASRFKQDFREDAEFGRLDYSHMAAPTGTRDADDAEAVVEGEEEAQDEVSLADEARSVGYRLEGKEVPIEPFNLKDERRLGYYDASGNFIFTRRDRDGEEDDEVGDEMDDLDKEHRADREQADAWLRDADTLATTRSVPDRKPPPAAAAEPEVVDLKELKRQVCDVLLPEETLGQGLKRLGNTIKLARAAQGKARGKAKAKGPKEAEPDDATKEKAAAHLAESKAKLELLTTAASKLFDEGWTNVYDYTRERFLSTLLDEHSSRPQQSLLGASSSSGSSGGGGGGVGGWEYKMAEEGELHGPYTTEQMAAWYDEGFFRGESVALVRRVGGSDFVRSDTISFRQELQRPSSSSSSSSA